MAVSKQRDLSRHMRHRTGGQEDSLQPPNRGEPKAETPHFKKGLWRYEEDVPFANHPVLVTKQGF